MICLIISGEFTVHECASTLKTFLSDLPEPLLTDAYYKAHCQVANMNDVEFVSKKIQCLVNGTNHNLKGSTYLKVVQLHHLFLFFFSNCYSS